MPLRYNANDSLEARVDKLNNYYYLEERAEADPGHLFLIYEGQKWTTGEAMIQVLQWANYMLSMNVKPQDIVALNFTNKPAYIFAMYGAWAIGATPALINFNLQNAALAHCVEISTAKLMIYDEEVSENVSSVSFNIRVLQYGESGDITPKILSQQSLRRPSNSLRSGATPTSQAVLIYTSGSTGLPKAAIVSWAKFSQGAVGSSNILKLTERDRFYTCMPIYHGTAMVLGIGLCMVSGATLVLGHKFSNKTFWSEVRDSKATVIQYVGEVARYLLAAPPSPEDTQHCVRMAFGNGMRPDLFARFRARFSVTTIAEFYASSEGIGGSFNLNSNDFGIGAVGKSGFIARTLFKTFCLIKVDLDSEEELRTNGLCQVCKPGEVGEICFEVDETSPLKTFRGYFNNEKASQSKLIRNVKKQGDVYLRMGDLMSLDKDGYLYFHDRLGDTFRWKGENVSTTEVAEALGSYQGVQDANVYGVQLPNHDGRAGCVALSLTNDIEFSEFAKHAHRGLPKYAVPKFIRLVGATELTGNYKLQKVALRKEGVDPRLVKDRVLWLKDGDFVEFTEKDWNEIVGGKARL